MQRRRAGQRHLRVGHAVPGGHQVELPRPHGGVPAPAVAVLDLTREQPAHRLEPGVRVRRHEHAARERDVVRSVVVDEAPRPDERTRPLRQRPADGHGAGAAQGHLPRGDRLDRHAGVAHCSTVPSAADRGRAASKVTLTRMCCSTRIFALQARVTTIIVVPRTAASRMRHAVAMGEDVGTKVFTREDRQRYREKVHRCLDVLARMLAESRFDFDHPLTGMEVELNLVDDTGVPTHAQHRGARAPRRPRVRAGARPVQPRDQRAAAQPRAATARRATSTRCATAQRRRTIARRARRPHGDDRHPADPARPST